MRQTLFGTLATLIIVLMFGAALSAGKLQAESQIKAWNAKTLVKGQ